MKLTEELKNVMSLMINRLQDHEHAAFGIPGDLISPDTATAEELAALDEAGFVWVDEEEYRGYKMWFNAD